MVRRRVDVALFNVLVDISRRAMMSDIIRELTLQQCWNLYCGSVWIKV